MARRLRVQFDGAIYHVTVRGVERRDIFGDDRDRERFLDQLARAVELDGVRLYLFCLMRNHVHLLIETPRGNLSAFMHRLQTAYTVYFNLRHQRAGHLVQGRYGAVLVEGDEYLLTMSRYVHLNPVFTRRVKGLPLKERIRHLREYRWSSYRGYIGTTKRLNFMDYEPVLRLVGGRESRLGLTYRNFVESGIAETDEEFRAIMAKCGLGIGSEEFCAKVRDRHLDLVSHLKRSEDASFRRQGRWLGEAAILGEVAKSLRLEPRHLAKGWGRGWGRPLTAKMLCKYGGKTQRETATLLGVKTGAAVCIQLRKLEDELKENPCLQAQAAALDGHLAEVLAASDGPSGSNH